MSIVMGSSPNTFISIYMCALAILAIAVPLTRDSPRCNKILVVLLKLGIVIGLLLIAVAGYYDLT